MAKNTVTEAPATATLDFKISGDAVKADDIAYAARQRSSQYDALVSTLHELKSGTGIVISPSDPKTMKNRPELLKLRNRLAAVARRAAKSHPKGFVFSVALAETGVALIAYKPE